MTTLLSCTTGSAVGDAPSSRDHDLRLWRRRIRHDIRHELGTIAMLAAAVAVSDDVGPGSRARIDALLSETRWLDHLFRQLDDEHALPPPSPERIRVDRFVGEIIAGLRLCSARRVGYRAAPTEAYIDPLALWRAVRNILDNACRIARRRVEVSVHDEAGPVIVQVDDDGPGFGAGVGGLSSLGLGIVRDVLAAYGGRMEIQRCDLGGARVRISLPSASRS